MRKQSGVLIHVSFNVVLCGYKYLLLVHVPWQVITYHYQVLVSKLKTKIHVYKTVIKPTLTNGFEAWTLTLKDTEKLLVVEQKNPGTKEDGSWKLKKISEIEDLMSERNIIGMANAVTLRWLMVFGEDRTDDRTVANEVRKDLKNLGIRDWQAQA